MDCLLEVSACTDLFSGIPCAKEEIQLAQGLKQRAHKRQKNTTVSSASLDIATTREWSWQSQKKLAAQQSPGRPYINSKIGIFLPHLSFPQDTQQQLWKTANTSLASAQIFFTSPLPAPFLLIVYK